MKNLFISHGAPNLILTETPAARFLGGELKRKEKISARLGDILSLLYLSSCALKRFEDEDRPAEDAPLLHWSVQDALCRACLAMDGVIANFHTFIVVDSCALSEETFSFLAE